MHTSLFSCRERPPKCLENKDWDRANRYHLLGKLTSSFLALDSGLIYIIEVIRIVVMDEASYLPTYNSSI